MNELFNEEPTIVIHRNDVEKKPLQKNNKIKSVELLDAERLLDNLSVYGSPLLNAATELLGTLVAIPRQGSPKNIDRFRYRLLAAMHNFKLRGMQLDYHPTVIEKSCFVLCAAFDEAILYSSWGEQVRWENQSLLSKIFSLRNGGETFFQLLEKACLQPSKLVDFIELQYVLLMLGFQGQYRHRDEDILIQIKTDLYEIIRTYRSESTFPAPKLPQLSEGRKPWNILSAGKVVWMAMFVFIVGYGSSEYWYYYRSQPIISEFQSIDSYKVDFNKVGNELIYVINSKNAESKPITVQVPQVEQINKNNKPTGAQEDWEILVAVFSTQPDALRFSAELKPYGEAITRSTDHGVEVILKAGNNLTEIRRIRNNLNERYGLDSKIIKALK